MSNKLKIITTESNDVTKNLDTIYIGGTKDYPYLAYKKQEGEDISDVIISAYGKSPYRPLHCSELFSKLKSRSWNKVDGCRFVLPTQTGERLYYKCYNSGMILDPLDFPVSEIDTISSDLINGSGIVVGSGRAFELCSSDLSENKAIPKLYKELFGEMATKIEELTLYSAAKESISITEDCLVIDLIEYDSDTYTDSISINPYIVMSSEENLTGTADLVIQYSVDDDVYTHNTSIFAFKYDKNSDILTKENYIEEIGNGDVILEYINGVIKVFPNKNSINECIITSCSLRYGKQ